MSQYITYIISAIVAIVSSIYFYKYKKSFLKYICFFLWYNAINEWIGYYIAEILEKDNGYLFNVNQIINYILIYWILINAISSRDRLKIVKSLFIIYAIIQVFDIVYKNFLYDYLIISYFIGGLVSILGIMYYAIELLQSQNITHLRKNLAVWFLMGNLIFWIGYLPIVIIYTNYENYNDNVLSSLEIIKKIFIIIQNTMFVIGFVYSEKDFYQKLYSLK